MNAAAPSTDTMHVLIADKLSPEGVAYLQAQEGVTVTVRPGLEEPALVEAAADADVVLVRSTARVTAKVIDAARRLKVVGRAGIGVDNIDVDAATRRGVLVMNVPDANANTTAEHALSMIFALVRNIPAADRSVREGRWEKTKFMGNEMEGKVLGVIGCGNIGRRVARKAKALGFEVIVHDPFLAKDALDELGVEVLPLEEVARRADILTLHVPKMDATKNLVDAALIARMKDGVRIVNCARGGIVNETDLLRGLESGKVAGAALDVFEKEPPPPDHPLFKRDDVVLTPHLGASTSEAQTRASVDLCRQVVDYLFRGEAKNVVNLPRMDPRALAELKPWMDLAVRLGRFLAGLLDAPAERIEVAFQGNLSALETGPVTRSFVAGLLSPAFSEPVNFVNALQLAQSRGLAVEERKSERIRDFASMLTGTATAKGRSISVSGTLFGHRQPRIVKVDDFLLEAIPEGRVLVIRNDDRPGVIGRIGSILGSAGVNIRAMHLSPPRERDGQALVLLNLSSLPTDDVVSEVRELPEVHRVALIPLDAEAPARGPRPQE